MSDATSSVVVSMGQARPHWDASPPPSWRQDRQNQRNNPGAYDSSPSMGPSRPFLPSVPGTPKMGSSPLSTLLPMNGAGLMNSTPQLESAPAHSQHAHAMNGGSDDSVMTDHHPSISVLNQRQAQLHDWQNKMHERFRKEMIGVGTPGISPLPMKLDHSAQRASEQSSVEHVGLHDLDKPYHQIQASPAPAGVPMEKYLQVTGGPFQSPTFASPPKAGPSQATGLVLDTSKQGLLPQSPAISGISSPGSAPLASPGIRFSSSPTSHSPYSPGVDSPGSWREELEFTRPVNETLNISKGQTNTSRDTTAAEDFFGPGCFSCFAFFGGKKKREAADSLNSSRATTRPSSPQTPTSPHKKALQEYGRLRLGIVIAHYRDPQDGQKKIHVVYGMSEDGAAKRSCLVHVGDTVLRVNRHAVGQLGNDEVKRKFEQAQRDGDDVLLALQRNGKEVKVKIHLLASYYARRGLHAGQHAPTSMPSSPRRNPSRDVYAEANHEMRKGPPMTTFTLNGMHGFPVAPNGLTTGFGAGGSRAGMGALAGNPLGQWPQVPQPGMSMGMMLPPPSPTMGGSHPMPRTTMSSRGRAPATQRS